MFKAFGSRLKKALASDGSGRTSSSTGHRSQRGTQNSEASMHAVSSNSNAMHKSGRVDENRERVQSATDRSTGTSSNPAMDSSSGNPSPTPPRPPAPTAAAAPPPPPASLPSVQVSGKADAETKSRAAAAAAAGRAMQDAPPVHENAEADNGPGQAKVLAVSSACPEKMRREAWGIGDFDLISKIYCGKASRVFKAIDKKSGIEVALKLYKRGVIKDMQKIQAIREIQNHIMLSSPNILGMYAAWVDAKYIYMVLEFAPLGDLYRILRFRGSLPEKMIIAEVLTPLLSALETLHAAGLIHRDLKPENVVVTKSGIKLADLGLVINDLEEKPNTRLGTLDYMAPEIYAARHKHNPLDGKYDDSKGYTRKVDVWAVGIIAYELLTGKPPFDSEHVGDSIARICNLDYSFPDNMPPLAKDFISSILVKDPEARPEISALKRHPWILNTKGHASKPMAGASGPAKGGIQVRSASGQSTTIQARAGSRGGSFSWANMYSVMEPNNRITAQLRTTDAMGGVGTVPEESPEEVMHQATTIA